jgi:hypothetical protein
MWMSERDRRLLTASATASFRSFGMGQITPGNPLSHALQDRPPQFAAGVDVREVVDHIVNNIAATEAGGGSGEHGDRTGKGKASDKLTNKILENIGAATEMASG